MNFFSSQMSPSVKEKCCFIFCGNSDPESDDVSEGKQYTNLVDHACQLREVLDRCIESRKRLGPHLFQLEALARKSSRLNSQSI
ncbi:hypothetical protein X777_02674 [Ooceraea biroi]|uniref:Uncharacterized protein n=1 Tax=Ooceraea biroi TaxID=2015173 RepID=A0A026WLJ6_OOCBI|nr:hypothetical protein X777_02674 [Ooceraea biroi]